MHHLGMSKKDISSFLRTHNVSPTSQRVEMAFLILEKAQHLTAEEVYNLVNREFSKASRATIYNNLHLFVKIGLLNALDIAPGTTIYDSNTSEHHHFIDEQTGEIVDIEASGIDRDGIMQQAAMAVKKARGKIIQIENLQIVFSGRLKP